MGVGGRLFRFRLELCGHHATSSALVSAHGEYPADTALFRRAAVAVAMVLLALVVSLAAATSALDEADAVAAATINADRSPDTLLGKNMRRDLSGSAPELGEAATAPRELRGKKCNPKKDTSCCRVPRRARATLPPAASTLPPAPARCFPR